MSEYMNTKWCLTLYTELYIITISPKSNELIISISQNLETHEPSLYNCQYLLAYLLVNFTC